MKTFVRLFLIDCHQHALRWRLRIRWRVCMPKRWRLSVVSTLRWLLIDTLHHRTGVRPPRWDFRKLKDRVTAYDRLIEIHYRYYQFHANSLLAVSISALLRWLEQGFRVRELFLLLAIDTLLYLGSRDTLSKYYRRVEELLARDF